MTTKTAKRQFKEKDAVINKQKQRIDQLDRTANPQRYRFSSSAEFVHHFIPNYNNPSLHIWTKVGGEEYDSSKSVDWINPVWNSFTKGEATIYAGVRALGAGKRNAGRSAWCGL